MERAIESIFDAVLAGDRAVVEKNVSESLQAGLSPEEILNCGLISAMTEVGARFERQEFFVPEMLIAARAMQSGLTILKPHLLDTGVKTRGKIILGTVRGDLHDIGKNLVGMMLEGSGFEIIDLGTDVAPARFAEAVRTSSANIVGLSALLTTTMENMRSTMEALEDIGVRNQVKVMIGGAPVTEAFAKGIGADGYGADANRAVTLARELMG
jgi:5-methyltetrahydrofolate--homocysteine methyltransferase